MKEQKKSDDNGNKDRIETMNGSWHKHMDGSWHFFIDDKRVFSFSEKDAENLVSLFKESI